MIPYANKELFLMDSVEKQLHIAYEGGEITNNEFASEDFALTEKLTAQGGISFGECNSSYIEFSVGYGENPLKGKKLTVTITPRDISKESLAYAPAFKIGEFMVVSDKPTADRRWRKITAYDAMYGILNMDMLDWYDAIFPLPNEGENPVSLTLKEFRDSFFEYVGVPQEEVELPNDGVILTRTAEFKTLTGKTVINAICEINGCFGHIDRDGVFQYLYIHTPSTPLYPAINLYPKYSLYPKLAGNPIEVGIGYQYIYPLPELIYPSNDIYPGGDIYPVAYPMEVIDGMYTTATYEDYYTDTIGGVQIRNATNDIGITVGSGPTYVITGNFLAYGKSISALTHMANKILEKIEGIYYCPAEIVAQGNPMMQIGDSIVLHTKYATVETIIFQRKLKGIQSLIDTYASKGQKELKSNLNSQSQMISDANAKINEVKEDWQKVDKIIIDQLVEEIEKINEIDQSLTDLTEIAITTQNLASQTIQGSQIAAGTITADRLSATSLAAASLTINQVTINQTLHCKFGGNTDHSMSVVEVSGINDLVGKKIAYFLTE